KLRDLELVRLSARALLRMEHEVSIILQRRRATHRGIVLRRVSNHHDSEPVDSGLQPSETIMDDAHIGGRVLIRAGSRLLEGVDDDQPRLRANNALKHEVIVLTAGKEVRHLSTQVELTKPLRRRIRLIAVPVALQPRTRSGLHRLEPLASEEEHATMVIDRAELIIGVDLRQSPLVPGVIEDVHRHIKSQERLTSAVAAIEDADRP